MSVYLSGFCPEKNFFEFLVRTKRPDKFELFLSRVFLKTLKNQIYNTNIMSIIYYTRSAYIIIWDLFSRNEKKVIFSRKRPPNKLLTTKLKMLLINYTLNRKCSF